MGAFRALTKYHFKEGIEAGVLFAKTQGGHGSESRTGVIMKEIVGYGTAARGVLPELRALIDQFNADWKAGGFPEDCNKQRVASVEKAIKAIESATTQPELRNIVPVHRKAARKTSNPRKQTFPVETRSVQMKNLTLILGLLPLCAVARAADDGTPARGPSATSGAGLEVVVREARRAVGRGPAGGERTARRHGVWGHGPRTIATQRRHALGGRAL